MKNTEREKMINEMIDKVCRIYGFEAKETIRFCNLCEKTKNDNLIEKKYHKLVDNFDN